MLFSLFVTPEENHWVAVGRQKDRKRDFATRSSVLCGSYCHSTGFKTRQLHKTWKPFKTHQFSNLHCGNLTNGYWKMIKFRFEQQKKQSVFFKKVIWVNLFCRMLTSWPFRKSRWRDNKLTNTWYIPQKSNIDTNNCNFFKGVRHLFQGPSFWGPPAVSFRECIPLWVQRLFAQISGRESLHLHQPLFRSI